MRRVLVAAAGLAAALAAAQPAPRTGAEQKEALVRRLLNDSPAVARIEASGNAEALGYFRQARERHANAVALMAADPARAETELNEAMWLAGKARQLVPDPMRRAIDLRVQNRAMMLAIDSLRASYERHLARRRGVDPATRPTDEALTRINARIEEAVSYSNSEHVQDANRVLREAERELMAALGAVLGADTLDYSQRFATQAEEYAFEVARNRSYLDLLPIAREALAAGRDTAAAMAAHAARNAAFVDRAQRSAARQDYAGALEAVRQGTAQLQAALAVAGLAVPRDTSIAGGPK